MNKYYDMEGKEHEIVYRTPTEEEKKRAKENLEKEKELWIIIYLIIHLKEFF